MNTSNILSFADYSSFRSSLKDIEEESTCTGFLYVLFTEKNGRRVPVQRLAGVDVQGILYMGQTTKLLDRVSLLHRSFQNPPSALPNSTPKRPAKPASNSTPNLKQNSTSPS